MFYSVDYEVKCGGRDCKAPETETFDVIDDAIAYFKGIDIIKFFDDEEAEIPQGDREDANLVCTVYLRRDDTDEEGYPIESYILNSKTYSSMQKYK